MPPLLALVVALVLAVTLAKVARAAPVGKNADVYFIGNSLTRGISQDRLAWLFSQAGGNLRYGTQAAADTPLYSHWAMKTDAGAPLTTNNLNNHPPLAGNYNTILSTQPLSALILQPYQYWLDTNAAENAANPLRIGDRQSIGHFIDYARGNNPNNHVATTQVYLYGTWPKLLGIHYRNPATTGTVGTTPPYNFGNSYVEPGFSFADFNAACYLASNQGTHVLPNQPRQSVPNRDFFERLIAAVNDDCPTLPNRVKLIPVTDVFAMLDSKIRNGEIPGIEQYFTRPANASYYATARADDPFFPIPAGTAFSANHGVINFFCDQVHMNDQPHNGANDGTIGGYVAALTIYAVLSGESPVGLPVTSNGLGWQRFDPALDAELVNALQQIVWDVVRNDPLTGIPEPASVGVVVVPVLLFQRRKR